MECLEEIGIDEKDLRITAGLYWDQAAVVRTKINLSSEFSIKRGVRQGSVLSPELFNFYKEKKFKVVIDKNGVNISGMNVNNLRYADDTALTTLNGTVSQTLLDKVNAYGKPYGMEMNVAKQRVWKLVKLYIIVDLEFDGKPIEQVSKFVYLGRMTSEDGRGDARIAPRIVIAKRAFANMRKLLTSRSINIFLEIQAIKMSCLVYTYILS